MMTRAAVRRMEIGDDSPSTDSTIVKIPSIPN